MTILVCEFHLFVFSLFVAFRSTRFTALVKNLSLTGNPFGANSL